MEKPIIVVDGLNLFIRHFIANPSVSTRHDQVGGIVGFLSTVGHLANDFHASNVIVVWEGGGSQRRRKIFPEYKGKRRPQKLNRSYDATDIPDTLENRNWQVANIIAILKHVPVTQVYVENCEADDVIGYLCKRSFPDKDTIIVTSDRDMYQLVSEKIKIYSPGRKKIVDATGVTEEFGTSVRNFCLAKSICGDDSDNVPGLEGIGFKTLVKRFPTFSSEEDLTIEGIVSEAVTASQAKGSPKLYGKIAEGEGIIRRNWKLMYLDTSNLSANQISQINSALENAELKRDKIGLLREIVRCGIGTFDAHRFFASFNNVPRK